MPNRSPHKDQHHPMNHPGINIQSLPSSPVTVAASNTSQTAIPTNVLNQILIWLEQLKGSARTPAILTRSTQNHLVMGPTTDHSQSLSFLSGLAPHQPTESLNWLPTSQFSHNTDTSQVGTTLAKKVKANSSATYKGPPQDIQLWIMELNDFMNL